MNKFWMVYAEDNGCANYYLFCGTRQEAVEWAQQPGWQNQVVEPLSVENLEDAYGGIAMLSVVS